MDWARKLLERTRSAAQSFTMAVRMNDRYDLDGRDPNSDAGIAWPVADKHDRVEGPERPVCGKIRSMSFESTLRKFNSRACISMVNALAWRERRLWTNRAALGIIPASFLFGARHLKRKRGEP